MDQIDELLQRAYKEYKERLNSDPWYLHILEMIYECSNKPKIAFWMNMKKEYEEYRDEYIKELLAEIKEKYHVDDVHKYEPKEKILEEAQRRYDYEKANYENLNIERSE